MGVPFQLNYSQNQVTQFNIKVCYQYYLLTDRSASRRSVAGSRSRIADPRHHDDSLNEEDDSDENWAEVNLCFNVLS